MGLHLCKDTRGDDSLQEFGTYEELEEDSSAEKMGYFQKPELQISQQCSYDVFVAENWHEKLSIDVLRTDETEMKPECYSLPAPTDDEKLSIAVLTTSCSILKEQLNVKNIDLLQVEVDDASDGWGDIVEADIANIGRSYVMPDFKELPEKLLPIDSRERHTVPSMNLNDLKLSNGLSLGSKTSPSLFRDKSKNKWNDGRVTSEVEAIKRQIERLEKEKISKLSPNKLAMLNDVGYIEAESQDLAVAAGVEFEEVDEENTGVSDSLPNSIDMDFIENKTAKQMTNSSESASTKYFEHSSGECLETGNIARVQKS